MGRLKWPNLNSQNPIKAQRRNPHDPHYSKPWNG